MTLDNCVTVKLGQVRQLKMRRRQNNISLMELSLAYFYSSRLKELLTSEAIIFSTLWRRGSFVLTKVTQVLSLASFSENWHFIIFITLWGAASKQSYFLTLYHWGFCISFGSRCVVRIRQALKAETAPSRMACLGSHTATNILSKNGCTCWKKKVGTLIASSRKTRTWRWGGKQ